MRHSEERVMPVDVSQTVEFQASPVRFFLLIITALGCGVLSFTAAWRIWPSVAPGSFLQFAGWLGMPLFLGGSLAVVWRYLKSGLPVIKLSPEGFWDSRLSSAFVPWSDVEKLSVWEYKNNRALVLKVSDATWHEIPLSKMARWTRAANRSLGANGLCVVATEFSINFDELFQVFAAYIKAHGGKAD